MLDSVHGADFADNMRLIGQLSTVGLSFVLALVMGFGGGLLARRWLGTKPWLSFLGFFVGLAAGILNVYRDDAARGRARRSRHRDRPHRRTAEAVAMRERLVRPVVNASPSVAQFTRNLAIACAGLAVLAWLWRPARPAVALGVVGGGVLAGLSFWAIAGLVSQATGRGETGEIRRISRVSR